MSYLFIIILVFIVFLLIVARNHARGMSVFKPRPVVENNRAGIFSNIRRALCGFNVYRSFNNIKPSECGFEYSEHYFISELGVRLGGWYIKAEEEKGLVLLFNWFAGCKADNLVAADCFLKLGYSVFMLDLRGHGDSSGNRTFYGYYEYRDVLASLKYARQEFAPEKILVYGVSLGAVAAMKAMYMAEARIDGLILEAPFDRLINTIRHRVAAFHVPELIFADVLAIIGGIEQGYNPYEFNPYQYASEIDVPILVIYGSDDPFVKLDEVENIMSNLGNIAEARLFVAAGHGHGSLAVHDRVIFKKEVQLFLQEYIDI